MKQLTVILLSVILTLSMTVSAANAQNCNSAASVVADIYGKVHDQASALACRYVLSGPIPKYSTCFNTTSKIVNLNGTLVSFWNSKVNNSWATIGPRRLELNKNLTGTLVSTGGRKFVSFPILDKNSITITIDETKGKGKTSVVICKANSNNQYTTVATKWFNDTSQKKKNKSEKQTVTVNGAKDHIIVVHMDGKSVANTFGYKIRAQ